MTSPGHRKQLRLTEERRQRLLDRLDGRAPASESPLRAPSNRRSERRHSYRTSDLALIVEHPGGGISRLLVCGRNLSGGGIGFLHGGFLHPGSKCWINAPRSGAGADPSSSDEVDTLRGRIVSCRHIEGVVHEVGVKFDDRIDVARFLESSQDHEHTSMSVELPAITGRLVCLEPSRADAALLEHLLKPTGLDISIELNAEAVLACAARGQCDAICTELLPGDETPVMVQALRQRGFLGPIVLLTAEASQDRLKPSLDAGADAWMTKPFSAPELIEFIDRLMQSAACTSSVGGLYSELEEMPGMSALIGGFVVEAREQAGQLEALLKGNERELVRRVVLQLRGSAASYGFGVISETAGIAIKAIDDADTLEECAALVRRLAALCGRLATRIPCGVEEQKRRPEQAKERSK